MHSNKTASLLEHRLETYGLFYLLFSNPSKSIGYLQENFLQVNDCELGKRLYDEVMSMGEKDQAALHEEYNRLFESYGSVLAPPWESVYRDKDGLLFSECMLQVREFYHRFGVQFVRENQEPDDHLLTELEFMIYLINKSIDCIDSEEQRNDYIQASLTFMDEHLGTWVSRFCERIRVHSTSRFYVICADFFETMLQEDNKMVRECFQFH